MEGVHCEVQVWILTLKPNAILCSLFSFSISVIVGIKNEINYKKCIIYQIFVHFLATFQHTHHFDLNTYYNMALVFLCLKKAAAGHLADSAQQPSVHCHLWNASFLTTALFGRQNKSYSALNPGAIRQMLKMPFQFLEGSCVCTAV